MLPLKVSLISQIAQSNPVSLLLYNIQKSFKIGLLALWQDFSQISSIFPTKLYHEKFSIQQSATWTSTVVVKRSYLPVALGTNSSWLVTRDSSGRLMGSILLMGNLKIQSMKLLLKGGMLQRSNAFQGELMQFLFLANSSFTDLSYLYIYSSQVHSWSSLSRHFVSLITFCVLYSGGYLAGGRG